MKRTVLLAVPVLAAVVAGVALWREPSRIETTAASAEKRSESARDFSLVDHESRAITAETFRGQWLIVFFGFTHCPDFCPTTLFRLDQALTTLGATAGNVRVLFITVDPERDTSQVLANYLRPFGPQFIGASGTDEQIEAVTRTFRTYSRKQPASPDGSYAVDHSTLLYVLDPDGRLSRQLSSQATPDELAATLRGVIESRR